MTKQASIRVEGNELHLSGDLDFSNVMPLFEQSMVAFEQAVPIIKIDFKNVTSANSVALALMINWMRLAKHKAKRIQLENVSGEMLSLAKSAGLDGVLELAALYQ